MPALAMLQLSNDELRLRAEKLLTRLRDLPVCASVGKGKAQVGGGTLPRSIIPSVTIDVSLKNSTLNDIAARLRHSVPPVVGYIAGGKFKLDLRTVFPRQDEELARVLRAAIPAQ